MIIQDFLQIFPFRAVDMSDDPSAHHVAHHHARGEGDFKPTELRYGQIMGKSVLGQEHSRHWHHTWPWNGKKAIQRSHGV